VNSVVLASASATRARLLQAAGVAVTIEPSRADEEGLKVRLVNQGRTAAEIAELLACAKAAEVSERCDALVIGADQTLEFGGGLWSKGRGLVDVRRQLMRLRGHLFTLHSGAALARGGEILWREVQSANLVMRPFSEAFLDDYLGRNGEGLSGSLGGFELEGEGAQLFDEIDGDAFAILGLPLIPLLGGLREHGALPT
jgi:septum formation protein